MKIVRGNKSKETKSITYKLYETEGDNSLIVLTPRMRSVLLSSVEMISWRTRHDSIPSDLSSPDDFQSWIDDLRNRLMEPLDFCSLMIENAECFLSDETVQEHFDDAVEQSMNNQDIIDRINQIYNTYNNGVSPQELTANLFNTECNLDSIYAQVVQLVDTLDGLSLDILDLVTQVSGVVDRVGTLISAIPVVEASPIPSVFDFVENAIDGVKSEYEGTYTESLEINLKCEIFCLVKNSSDCTFNFSQILSFFLGKLNGELFYDDPVELVNSVLNYLVSGDMDGDIAVYAMHAFACSVLASGSSFLGETFTGLVSLIYAQNDETNNDWIAVCEDCTEYNCMHNGIETYFPIGDLVEETPSYIIMDAEYGTFGGYTGYFIEFGDTSRSHFCYYQGYEIISGSWNAIGSTPDGFISWTTGDTPLEYVEKDKTREDYQVCLLSVATDSPLRIKFIIG